MNRATKYCPHYPDLVRWMARNGLTLAEIATALGVNRDTLYRWRRKYPEFAEAMDDGRDLADARVEDSLYQSALSGNVTAQIFWLCNRRREHWRHVQRIEHTGAEGKPIEHEHEYAKLTDEELEARIVAEAERITGGAAPA